MGEHHGPHPPQPDIEDLPFSRHEVLACAVEELLIDRDVFGVDDMRRGLERLELRGPAHGARLVARCWTDPGFEQRVLADVNRAARELGLDVGETPIRAVKNTEHVHNVIVCTLCSCYPSGLLGAAPDWYKSRAYRARVVREPRAVLAEFGIVVPEQVEVRVHDSSADLRYLVIPRRPVGSEPLNEAELAALVTRDCMIGTAVPRSP